VANAIVVVVGIKIKMITNKTQLQRCLGMVNFYEYQANADGISCLHGY
jgi:hypothetical protein